METLSSSKFHVCPETSKNALLNKRNNKQKLVQLPEAIYRSLLPHTQNLSSFTSDFGPWKISDEKYNDTTMSHSSTSQHYSTLGSTTTNLISSVSDSNAEVVLSPRAKSFEPRSKFAKGKKTSSSSLNRNKMNTSKDLLKSSRTPLPIKHSSKFPFLYHGMKDISYVFPKTLEPSQHTAHYRRSYTYKVLSQYHEVKGNNQKSFRASLYDQNLFFAKCKSRGRQFSKAVHNSEGIDQKAMLQSAKKPEMKLSPKTSVQQIIFSMNKRDQQVKKKLPGDQLIIESRRCRSAEKSKFLEAKSKMSSRSEDAKSPLSTCLQKQIDAEIIPSFHIDKNISIAKQQFRRDLNSVLNISKTSSKSFNQCKSEMSSQKLYKGGLNTLKNPRRKAAIKKLEIQPKQNTSQHKIGESNFSRVTSGYTVSLIQKSIQNIGTVVKPVKTYVKSKKDDN